MNLKEIDKIVRDARSENKVLVLNFSGKDLVFASKEWLVIDVEKRLLHTENLTTEI